jgi:putative ABC transport system permease protein
MDGAFNAASVRLAPGANPDAVIAAIDGVLDRWGGRGAYPRAEQASDRFLSDELAEQRTVAIVAPLVFFGVAGFLLNVILGRLVDLQREQVAALKALGFPTAPIVVHYLKFAAVIWALGAATGLALGVLQGVLTLEAYRPFFRFAAMPLVVPAWLPLAALAASGALTVGATTTAVLNVLRLPAAVAMQASAPVAFGAAPWLRGLRMPTTATLIVRSTLGRPLRSLLSVLGLAMALPITVFGFFWFDALDTMRDIQFGAIERSDAVVALTEALPVAAVREFERLPGVLLAEGSRSVPVRLSSGAARHRTVLSGVGSDARLFVPRDSGLHPIPVPPGGLVLSRRLAGKLSVDLGDSVAVDVLSDRRRSGALPVVGLVDDILGMTASVEAGTLSRFLSEDDRVTEVRLLVDPARADALWDTLAGRPKVAGTSTRTAILAVFDDLVAGLLTVSAAILAGFGVLITIGVVYNSARIGFHERSRELASLRILGFTRGEVGTLLLAEFALMTAVAIPIGLAAAQGLVTLILTSRANESFDLPSRVSPFTFALAALTVAAAAAASALAVRRRIDSLDLVAILKARD